MRGDDAYAILKKMIKNSGEPGATPEQAAQIQQNKEDIITLKGEANKKITKIYASSQGETHLEDSDNGPIQNMMLYGKSEQKQYSGKNLLKATLQTTTQNGVTCTANGDGTYTLNGTANAFILIEMTGIIDNKFGSAKIIGTPKGGNSNTYFLWVTYCNVEGVEVTSSEYSIDDNGIVISSDYPKVKIRLVVRESVTCNNLLFKPMITTDLTATYDDFEPYTGGQPSPSPDYPQEIKSVVNPTVKVCGKNLLDTDEIKTFKNVTISDGTVNQTSADTRTELRWKVVQYGLNDTILSINSSTVLQNKSRFGVTFTAVENTTKIAFGLNGEKTDTTVAVPVKLKTGQKYVISCNLLNSTQGSIKWSEMMLEEGSTLTPYEPYHEQTVTLPYDLYGAKVASGGNITIDGQEYVSDYFDVERGKLVRMVANNRLLSAYNWNTANEYYWGSVSATTNGKAPITADNSKKMCACNYLFASSTYDVMAKKSGIAINNIKQVVIGLNDFASVDELKTFLTNNDVRLVYPLEVPEEIDLTPGEIQALKALATYYPVTNISINSEELDGYTIFNYPLSFEDEWNNVKQQVNDIKKDYLTKEDAEKEYQPKGDYLTKTAADDKYQTKAEAAEEKAAVIDMIYKDKVAAATTKAEVDTLFAEWWKSQYDSDTYSKSDMLERWFGNVLVDNRVHGVKTPLYAKSTSMIGELTDDSAGLVCTPSTEAVAGNDPFDHLPQFWCLEVSAEKQADGSHVIYYVEHIDSIDDVRSGEHLCWVLQKNTWKREWKDSEYKYLKMQCKEAEGYKRWPEGKDRTGKIHEYMAHPKYPGGMKDGLITCGTGLAPVNRNSHTNIVAKWRTRGKQYSGGSGSLPKFLDIMMRLKYGKKGNSGTIEGCTNYNFQYTVAVSETGVERIILTKAQAANLLVGSAIMLGIQSGTDRNTASNYSIFDGKLITKIEDVTINDTVYSAVYVDNGGKTFNTTAGSTYMSTSPYYSGWNDNVKGRDGSRYNYQNGKEPGMLQGVEFMHGSYIIVSDELWQWGTDADGNYTFDCFKCYDQSKAASSITNDYVKMDVPTLKFPQGTASWIWKYITDNAINDDVMWPETTDASGSGVGVGAGFSCVPASSGVRAAWVFGDLAYGGFGGVPCRCSGYGPSSAYWGGSSGAPGSEG